MTTADQGDRSGVHPVILWVSVAVALIACFSLVAFPPFALDFLRATDKTLTIETEVGGQSTVSLPRTDGRIEVELTPAEDFVVLSEHSTARGGTIVIDDCAAGCSLVFRRLAASAEDSFVRISYSENDSDYVDDIGFNE